MTGEPSEPVFATHDVIAIGCGPFNLGLVALASTLPSLDLVAFEAQPELRWHPGLMFDDAKLQLSFLADLVTLVDPTHPLSFLAYLSDRDRMYPFFIREQFHPTRREYEDYLRWAASKLPSVRFSHRVLRVEWLAERAVFGVDVATAARECRVFARNVVLGIGTEPSVPQALSGLPQACSLHSSDYLERKRDVKDARHVTVIGSGQSAAEIVVDLLRENLEGGPAFSWLTRTPSFAPLDYSKLVLEMTTPAYVRYFHQLPQEVKDRLVAEQWRHYKGISTETLELIFDLLYQRELGSGLNPIELRSGVAVDGGKLDSGGRVALDCRHRDTDRVVEHTTDLVIFATGYRERRPGFLEPLEPFLRRDDKGRFSVRLDYSLELEPGVTGRVFVANAELHSHGVATPDLGVGAYRNGTILNAVVGKEIYRLPQRTAFSHFSVPERSRESSAQVRRRTSGRGSAAAHQERPA